MPKKKTGKHLQFYMVCMKDNRMPRGGLCSCSWNGLIDEALLLLFKPEYASTFSYWAAGEVVVDYYKFTKLRQTIVLFMAAIKNEL
jgi:hypothetical protein